MTTFLDDNLKSKLKSQTKTNSKYQEFLALIINIHNLGINWLEFKKAD